MKSFLQLNEEKQKSLAMLFGRMNPPTAGHEENVEGLKKMAHENNADHLVVASHSHDAKKNPLDPKTKLKHLKRAFPDTNVTVSSKEQPTIMHQAAEAHRKGYNHLIIAGGGDRVKEYHHLLNKYNGVEGRHGYYKFDRIEVKSTGDRKAGVSGTDMRNHVQNGNFNEFRKHLPSNIKKDQGHSLELFKDVGKGMGLHESNNRGQYKAIFVTGGPGSGKDVVIRECIAEQNIVEFNFQQVMDILNDKHKLAMRSMGPKSEAIRHRGPLIINGPADDFEKISSIKEELEELGYQTMMVFVDTTDKVSQERNTLLARMMLESTRHQRWTEAQKNIEQFSGLFENFSRFDNTGDLADKIDDISALFTETTNFLDQGTVQFTSANRFLQIYESSKSIQRHNLAAKGLNVLKDNNSPTMQLAAKMGKRDDVRDGDIKSNSDYSPKIGGGNTYTEDSQPKLTVNPEPKVANFNKDNDTKKKSRMGLRALNAAKASTPDGVTSTYDTRGGSGAAGAGLGDSTYRESTEFSNNDVANFSAMTKGPQPNPLAEKNKRLKKFKESIFDFGSGDSGVGGTLGGASNKEPMVTPADKYGQSGITIKKKKTGAK
jgi:nicotinamide mononucleotide adenylyltransferase